MEVAQAIDAGQVVERWDEYFERVVAGITDLDEAVINEMRDELFTENCVLEIEDVADTERHRRLVEMAKHLLGGYRQSATVAQTIVSELLRPTAPPSQSSCFPVSDTRALPEVDSLLERFEELMTELRRHGDYQRSRKEYCQLSILLNLQGLMAPAFRPAPVTGKKFGDPVFKAIHRDQIVIDCHWLQVTKAFVKVRAKDIEFAPMFRAAKPFLFDLAWQFANKVWTANHRVVDMLRLTEFQQCQLAALRSDVVKKRVEGIENGSRKEGVFIPAPLSFFEQGLSAWCERDRRIHKHREGYAAVWKARSFLGEAASVRQVGQLAAMMLGEAPKDDKTIRSREDNIGRHILGG